MGQSAKKQRMCPAVGRGVGAAECGENRISRYQCPPDCPHNPWALGAYVHEMAIESAFFDHLWRYAAQDPVTRGQRIGLDPTRITDHFSNLRNWFILRDGQGRTLMDRWEQTGFPGLNNDGRVLARCHAKVKVMAGEVLDHVSDDAVRVQDRFDLSAPPIVVMDRSLAQQAGRFTRLLVWAFPLPHYSRITAAAFFVPDIGSLEAEEIIGAVSEHLGGPLSGEPLREWLRANFDVAVNAIEALSEATRRKMFENVIFVKIAYRVEGPAQTFIDALSAAPEAVLNAPSEADRKEGFSHEWAWLDQNEEAIRGAAQGARPTLGRVLFAQDRNRIRLEGGGQDRARRLQEAFEQRLGRLVVLEGRRVDDVGRQMIARDGKPFDSSLVPPRLLDLAPRIETSVQLVEAKSDVSAAALMRASRRKWVDQAIPSLGGKTPREAAADPALRPKVVGLVKEAIRRADRQGLQEDRFEDEGWMAVELGLTELQRPVPPRLARRAEESERREAQRLGVEREDSADGNEATIPAARILAAMKEPGSLVAIRDAFRTECPDFSEWVDNVTSDLEEREYVLIESLVAMAWHISRPPDGRALAPNVDRIDHKMRALMQESASFVGEPEKWFHTLVPKEGAGHSTLLCALLLAASELAPKPRPPNPIGQQAALLGMFMIHAVTDELDRAAMGG